MLSSLLLDALLVLILLMMIPLGFLRGGLREVCTAAGLLFGILLANEWAGRWCDWFAGRLNVDAGAAGFLVSVVLVVLSGGLIGYGGSAAFSYRPGPGGRMYGAYIALFNGIILAGYLINRVIAFVYDGSAPEVIDKAFVARGLSAGFGWILLLCAGGVLAGTLFGMIVRERPDETSPYAYSPAQPVHAPGQPTAAPAASVEPAPAPAEPLRIREVRHWEEAPQAAPQEHGYGSGWRQTWPDPRGQGPVPPWEQRTAPPVPSPKRVTPPPRRPGESPATSRDVLRDWMRDDSSGESR